MFRSLVILALFAASALPAQSQEAMVAASPEPTAIDGAMIIWSGAKTKTEADKQLAEFNKYAAALKELVTVDAQVIESATVKGLNPGFFVVALGVCDDLDFPLGVFQAIEPAVYTRQVHYAADDAYAAPVCPAPVQVAAESDDQSPIYWELGHATRVTSKAGTLVALPFTYDWSEQGDFAREYFEADVVLLLIAPNRTLLDSRLYNGPSDATRLTSIAAAAHTISWDLDYAKPPCDPSGDRFVAWKQSVSAIATRGAIVVTPGAAQRVKSGSCGYAEESDAIQGKHKSR